VRGSRSGSRCQPRDAFEAVGGGNAGLFPGLGGRFAGGSLDPPGKEAIQYATGYALEAERQMGLLLLATKRAKGGNPRLTGTPAAPVSGAAPTLADLGVTKKESAHARKLALLPSVEFDAIKAGKKVMVQVLRVEGLCHPTWCGRVVEP